MNADKYVQPVTVLFVEDEEDIREQMEETLDRVVERYYMAENGADGLRMYQEFAPDIIVTDIRMPIMNGIEMARQIKDINPKAQIIVMSAYSDAENLMELIDIGINSFVLKPVAGNKFIAALEHCADYVILARNKVKYEIERENMLKLLELKVITDPLTGIYNRAKCNDELNLEMERSRRYGSPLSLIMLDIDLFKRINDSKGHLVGDRVLIELCRTVTERIRSCDTFARWGGEEFTLLLPGNSLDSADRLAEQLRSLIAQSSFANLSQVTCSFGVTQFQIDDTLESFTGRSDKALYLAKQKGRNRVESI